MSEQIFVIIQGPSGKPRATFRFKRYPENCNFSIFKIQCGDAKIKTVVTENVDIWLRQEYGCLERHHLLNYLIKMAIKHLKKPCHFIRNKKMPQNDTELKKDISHILEEEKSKTNWELMTFLSPSENRATRQTMLLNSGETQKAAERNRTYAFAWGQTCLGAIWICWEV